MLYLTKAIEIYASVKLRDGTKQDLIGKSAKDDSTTGSQQHHFLDWQLIAK